MAETYGIGSYVALHLDKDNPAVVPGLLKYDGTIHKISRAVYMHKMNGHSTGAKYLELEGVVSEYGLPYGIDPAWCRKV